MYTQQRPCCCWCKRNINGWEFTAGIFSHKPNELCTTTTTCSTGKWRDMEEAPEVPSLKKEIIYLFSVTLCEQVWEPLINWTEYEPYECRTTQPSHETHKTTTLVMFLLSPLCFPLCSLLSLLSQTLQLHVWDYSCRTLRVKLIIKEPNSELWSAAFYPGTKNKNMVKEEKKIKDVNRIIKGKKQPTHCSHRNNRPRAIID